MDNYNPNQFNPYQNPHGFSPHGEPVRSQAPVNYFETAAWVLGIAGLVSCLSFYGAYICGALAIMFALLSRGGQITMTNKARRGLLLGATAIILTTIIFIVTFYIAIEMFGSLEGIVREYCEIYGYDFEEIFGKLFAQ